MPETQIVARWIVLLSLRACLDRLRVQLMHIIDERKVVVGVEMVRVEVRAELHVLHRRVVPCRLKVSQAQIVLKLRVISLELTRFLEGFESYGEVVHFI